MFPQSASGNVAPLRAISGVSTGASRSFQVAVFAGEIYIATFDTHSVDVFPLGANGDVAPVRRITGPATLLSGPTGLCVF